MSNSSGKIQLLIVEDDINLSLVIQDYLQILDYEVTLCKDGEEGALAVSGKKFDLIILDVMMPKMDGFSLATEIRKTDENTPIIILTAKSLPEDRIKGFKSGCDDYLIKPFSMEELSLRIKSILKRCAIDVSPQEQKSFKIGKFSFDADNMVLMSNDSKKNLTKKEAGLLLLLCKHKNQLLPRKTALVELWGEDDYFYGRSMDVFITRLRKLLKPDPNISIKNIHGSGFKLEVK